VHEPATAAMLVPLRGSETYDLGVSGPSALATDEHDDHLADRASSRGWHQALLLRKRSVQEAWEAGCALFCHCFSSPVRLIRLQRLGKLLSQVAAASRHREKGLKMLSASRWRFFKNFYSA
jgi:hypothetical protein